MPVGVAETLFQFAYAIAQCVREEEVRQAECPVREQLIAAAGHELLAGIFVQQMHRVACEVEQLVGQTRDSVK